MNYKILFCIGVFSAFNVFCLITAQEDIVFETVGNKTIYIHKEFLNWYEAFQNCASLGLQLLTINTALENFLISEHLRRPYILYWTSGVDNGSGDWAWMTTGKTFDETFNYWFPTKPNVTTACDKDSYLMVGYQSSACWLWWSRPYKSVVYSICEKPMELP